MISLSGFIASLALDNLLIIFLIKKSIDSAIFSPVLADVLKHPVKLLSFENFVKFSVLFISSGGNKSALLSAKIEGKGFPSLDN